MNSATRGLQAFIWLLIASALAICSACTPSGSAPADAVSTRGALIGAWRSQIHFSTGSFAQIKDLEFMYVFNQGGTMTESSNYDDAPPVPPAYGIWRTTGARQFEAKYLFYITAAPKDLNEITSGGGWNPSGYGVLTERIQLSEDGQTYSSTIDYKAFDSQGKPADGGGQGHCSGKRISF